MKSAFSILSLFAAVFALAACTSSVPVESETPAAPQIEETPEPAPAVIKTPTGKIEILSRHDTNAVFEGTREHRCMGRTMLCPDRCGNSGTLAVFKIEGYNSYEKPGKYGDPQADEFVFMLKSSTGKSDVSPEIAEQIGALKPGDKVRLVWDHVYISDENGSRPERPVRLIKAR